MMLKLNLQYSSLTSRPAPAWIQTVPGACSHNTVEHGAPDVVVNNLIVQLSVEILPSDQDGDDPEERGEQQVECAEEEIEPPDWRHPSVVLSAGHEFVRHNDGKVMRPVAKNQQMRITEDQGQSSEALP